MIKKIKGNLISLAKEGMFDAIIHGCNCFCTMGSGLAPQMAKHFNADKFGLEDRKYYGDYNKLGVYQAMSITVNQNGHTHWTKNFQTDTNPSANTTRFDVINAYTQYRFDTRKDFDYLAFELICKKLNHKYKGKHIGFPWIGCGRAGAQKHRVEHVIKQLMPDVRVTIVEYTGNDPGSKV